MIDSDGISLRYTAMQRMFESKLVRHRNIPRKEKDAAGVTKLEAKLSEHSSRTNDPKSSGITSMQKRSLRILPTRHVEKLEA